MTSTENFFRDGYLADWTHHWRRSRFIQETWQSPSDRHSHQLWIQTRWLELHLHRQSNRGCSESPTSPNPMGLLSSIFANDNKGPIDKETLCTLCVLILDIVREIEDLKSSKYIKALICFLVLHTRMKEKHQFSSINYSRLLLKKITGTGKITRKRST